LTEALKNDSHGVANAMKKIVESIIILGFSSSIVSADIQLEWEYSVGSEDFTAIENPSEDPLHIPSYGISRIKVGASGHTLALLERPLFFHHVGDTFVEVPHERRLAMFDAQGNRIWLSDDLSFVLNTVSANGFRILNVSPDSASALIKTMTYPESLIMISINLNASPQLTQLVVTEQKIADSNEVLSMTTVEVPSLFPPNTFYTIGNPPGSMGVIDSLGSIIRKFSLNTLSGAPVVVASASGTDGNNFVIQWQSTVNVTYQVQESANLAAWTNVGQSLTGNGAQLSWSAPLVSGSKFYRIIQP